jgi:hypothetical protein
MRFRYMTIILYTKRDSFVVLAADQAASRRLPDGTHRVEDYYTKLVCHAYLPLACGVAGEACLPFNGIDARPTAHVEAVLKTITTHDLDIHYIGERLRDRFVSAIGAMDAQVGVYIALVIGGQPQVGLQEIGKRTALTMNPLACTPEEVRLLYEGKGLWAFLNDETITDRDEVVRRARQLVDEGIRHEASLHSGENQLCGGKPDVALVVAGWAKLV